MLLIRNANVYSPAPMGRKDVLIEGDKVIKIADRIAGDYSELNVKTVEAGQDIGAGLCRSARSCHRSWRRGGLCYTDSGNADKQYSKAWHNHDSRTSRN